MKEDFLVGDRVMHSLATRTGPRASWSQAWQKIATVTGTDIVASTVVYKFLWDGGEGTTESRCYSEIMRLYERVKEGK